MFNALLQLYLSIWHGFNQPKYITLPHRMNVGRILFSWWLLISCLHVLCAPYLSVLKKMIFATTTDLDICSLIIFNYLFTIQLFCKRWLIIKLYLQITRRYMCLSGQVKIHRFNPIRWNLHFIFLMNAQWRLKLRVVFSTAWEGFRNFQYITHFQAWECISLINN